MNDPLLSIQMTNPAVAAVGVVSELPAASTPRRKQSQDTVDGCRERAAANLAEAAMIDTVNGRKRLEASAAAWAERGNLLQRIQNSFEKRKLLDAADWQREEAAEKRLFLDEESEQHHVLS